MRCPNCKQKLTYQDSVNKGAEGTVYHCKACGADSAYKHGIGFWLIFLFVLAPIIEFLIRTIIEITLQPMFGPIYLGDLEIYRAVSICVTVILMILIFFKINRLVVNK